MASTRRLKVLESKLTPQQQKAAFLLVENDLRDNGQKRTLEEIAEEVGVTYKTIWSWRKTNRNFIDYKNEIADDFLAEHRAGVYGQMMKLINAPQPSVKAISLYLQRYGLLTQRTQVETIDTSGGRSNDDLAKELEEIDNLLED